MRELVEEFELLGQSNRIQLLLEEADERGYLTFDQVLEVFPEVEDDLDKLEYLFATLYDQGVAVYDTEQEALEAGEADGIDGLNEAMVGKEKSGQDGDERRIPDLSAISVKDSISLYFSEMGCEPLLNREEEVKLARQLDQGREARRQLAENGRDPQERARLERLIAQGERAREHLIKANTRLVVSVAKKYRGQGIPFLDLIQAGNVGLIKAVDKFDYRRGTKVGTYVTWWIRQSITRSLTQQGRTIRIPVHMSDRIRKVYKASQRLEQSFGRRPTPAEIAEEMGLDPEKVRWMLRVSRLPLSLEKPVGAEGDTELSTFIEDESAPAPDQSAERHLLREDLESMLVTLTPREARVLRLRFGLNGDRGHTLEEIGNRLGVTRERVRQIERKALRKLRHPRHTRRLRSYLS
jgi:RNA polymerase primary sigma factor